MKTLTPVSADRGHAHDVDLEDTFDFLNTDDTENGFPADKLPTLDDALAWFVDRGVIHVEGANRVRAKVSSNDPLMERDLARVQAVRSALREVAFSIAEDRAPDTRALDTINTALHARQVAGHQRVAARDLGADAVGALDVDDAPIDEPRERIVEGRELVDGETIFGVVGVQEVEGVLQIDVMGVTPVNGIGRRVNVHLITTLYLLTGYAQEGKVHLVTDQAVKTG